MNDFEKFKQIEEQRKNNINQIAQKLSEGFTSGAKNLDAKLADGSTVEVTSMAHNGRDIFIVSKNNKNTMTVTSKESLKDLIGD
jgi:hypothetical protein